MEHLNRLISESRKGRFNVGPYSIVSQMPSILDEVSRKIVVPRYLPQFIAFWKDLEAATGHAWKCTSYIRDSPSHKHGHAFDLAPDIADHAKAHYAVYRGSDPVLYKRERLMRQLQTLRDNDYSADGSNKLGVFIEPDHLHVQVLAADGGGDYPTNIVKWAVPKPVYEDTYQRMAMPVLKD